MLGLEDTRIIFRDLAAVAAKEAPPAHGAGTHKFGRMLDIRDETAAAAAPLEILRLSALGTAVNSTQTFFDAAGKPVSDDSDIPAGYTYLGQFIAHEVAFDPREVAPIEAVDVDALRQVRSPALDLDGLYAGGPAAAPAGMFEADGVRMKVERTTGSRFWGARVPHDLPRHPPGHPEHRHAVIGDERNDENLATAQTHLAFIYFHNAVADWIDQGADAPATFEKVRDLVVRHFQWVVLKDFLPRVIDAGAIWKVLAHVRSQGGQPEFFKPLAGGELYTPVEFSGAAFRFGHSMVRNSYEWNFFHTSGDILNSARPSDLFEQTGFRGSFTGADGKPHDTLLSDWVISWRRFFDFPGSGVPFNKAKKIDTSFDFSLEGVPAFSRGGAPTPLTTRNLLRGFAYRLPSGQEAADRLGEEKLPDDEVARGPHEALLRTHGFHARTPLWYYVMKEAQTLGRGNRLGPVGSRIVAETLVGLILNSGFSILDPADPEKDWTPVLPVPWGGEFDMPALLSFAKVVNPAGKD